MLKLSVQILQCALRDRKGVTSLEYGVIAAAVIAAITVAMTTIGTDLSTIFTSIATKLTAVAGGS